MAGSRWKMPIKDTAEEISWCVLSFGRERYIWLAFCEN